MIHPKVNNLWAWAQQEMGKTLVALAKPDDYPKTTYHRRQGQDVNLQSCKIQNGEGAGNWANKQMTKPWSASLWPETTHWSFNETDNRLEETMNVQWNRSFRPNIQQQWTSMRSEKLVWTLIRYGISRNLVVATLSESVATSSKHRTKSEPEGNVTATMNKKCNRKCDGNGNHKVWQLPREFFINHHLQGALRARSLYIAPARN